MAKIQKNVKTTIEATVNVVFNVSGVGSGGDGGVNGVNEVNGFVVVAGGSGSGVKGCQV